jgi:excisionase family DNA binding protein
MDKLLLTPEEAARTLSIGRSKLYELLRTGSLGSVRIGGSRRIPVAALHAYVVELGTNKRPSAA